MTIPLGLNNPVTRAPEVVGLHGPTVGDQRRATFVAVWKLVPGLVELGPVHVLDRRARRGVRTAHTSYVGMDAGFVARQRFLDRLSADGDVPTARPARLLDGGR